MMDGAGRELADNGIIALQDAGFTLSMVVTTHD